MNDQSLAHCTSTMAPVTPNTFEPVHNVDYCNLQPGMLIDGFILETF